MTVRCFCAERRLDAPQWMHLLGVVSVALASFVLLNCGETDSVPASPSAQDVSVLRPGDSLLERLEGAELVQIPAHNLQAEVAASLPENLRIDVAVGPLAWQRAEAMPASWSAELAALDQGDLWWAQSPVPLAKGGPDPVVRVGGEEAPAWRFGDGSTMPEGFAGWFRAQRLLLAVSKEIPQQVSLEATVSAVSEFGRLERGRALHGEDPAPTGLVTRVELGEVKRSALLLPAPGILDFPPAKLAADRLHVAVGVAGDGWVMENGVLKRRRASSDGVFFAVDVLPWAEATSKEGGVPDATRALRAWSAFVPADEVGKHWVEAEIDLSRWRGQIVSLRLVTQPTNESESGGNPEHDYALWSDLRLRGGATLKPNFPHVVLIDIDTLRADRLAAYGAKREATPGLDSWSAQRAMTYTDSVSSASWTLPSTVSFLTGMAVHQHGVEKASDALGRGAPTLASRLAQAGYETHAIAGGGYLRPEYGCDVGFESFETRAPKDLDWTAALDFVRTRDSERPFFLFLHTYYVHAPYAFDPRWVDPEYDGALREIEVHTGTVFEPWQRGELDLDQLDGAYVEALYDGLVSQMDVKVAAFLEALNELIPDGQLMIVLTSDHGEAFLEHGDLGHGVSLYEEQLRVPLVVQYPDGKSGVSDVPASGVDVLPTVLDTVGLPLPAGLPGRSLRETVGPAVRVAQSDDGLRATLSDGYKLIERGAQPTLTELYALDVDAGELHDLSEVDVVQLEALRKRLEWYLSTHAAPEGGHAVDNQAGSDVLEELRALGYLGGGD